MTNVGVVLKSAIMLCALTLLLAACAAMEKSDAMDTERVLSAAGFQMKFADTGALKEQVKKLPQRKVAHVIRDGKLLFVYADSQFCKCMYVGSEAAYQRYQKLALEKNIAAEESMAVEDADMDWGAWGTWGPLY